MFMGIFQFERIFSHRHGFLNASAFFLLFPFCSSLASEMTTFDVTIKFNYAIKLHLIAKCVACAEQVFVTAID